MAAKKYTPKDINKNGKLDQWEINKYKLINKGKPQMGMGEQGALKPKFLKGLFSKEDGSMSAFGNVANAVGPLQGLVGIGKSIVDLVRGGNPAMMNKPMKSDDKVMGNKYYSEKDRKKSANLQKKAIVAASKGKTRKAVRLKKRSDKKDVIAQKPNNYVSAAQRKAVHASKKDGGKGNPNNKPKSTTIRFIDKKRDKYVVGNELTKTTKRKKKIKTVTKKRAAKITRKNLK